MTAREVALLTLAACDQQGAWSDGQLKKNLRAGGLDSRDAALATRLCYGIVQHKMLLDFYLSAYSSVKLAKMEVRVLEALRLGAYQLLMTDKIPVSAAVNESVALAKRYAKNPKASGLVNAVLRTIERNRHCLPTPGGNRLEQLSVLYSHPLWLVKQLEAELGGEGLEALLAANNQPTDMVVQVNTRRIGQDELAERLTQEGVTAGAHPWLKNALILSSTGDLEQLSAFQEGLFYVQDTAARLAVEAVQPLTHGAVLDLCAAPGGKSFAAALSMEGGTVVSCDLHPHKIPLIEKGAQRLGLTEISPRVGDATQFNPDFEGQFSTVLADVPCSGLGIIRKKPDIREKAPKPLEQLPAIQKKILQNACRYVAPGGTVLYATCTLLRRENEDVVAAVLAQEKDFTLECFQLPQPIGTVENGMITLWPHRHGTDGFFMAKLRRKGGCL